MSVELKLKDCPNYDKIVNFLYEENDTISKLLIHCYQEYSFTIKSNKSRLHIDEIMNLYTDKGDFYKFIQNYFDVSKSNELFDSYDKLIIKLNRLYKTYEEEKLKKVKNARWL